MFLFSRFTPASLGCSNTKAVHFTLTLFKTSKLAAARLEMRSFLTQCVDRVVGLKQVKCKHHIVLLHYLAMLDYYTWQLQIKFFFRHRVAISVKSYALPTEEYFGALLRLTWLVSLVKKALSFPAISADLRANDFSYKCANTCRILKWAARNANFLADVMLESKTKICNLLSPYAPEAKKETEKDIKKLAEYQP